MEKRVHLQVEHQVHHGEDQSIGQDKPIQWKQRQVENRENRSDAPRWPQPSTILLRQPCGWNQNQDQKRKPYRDIPCQDDC